MSGSGLSDLSGLVALAQQRDLDLRPVILRVQTDLFVTAPARDRIMIEAFEALACGLLPTVDDETAAIVARKLAPLEDTPEALLQALASRGGEALRAVLEGAICLPASILEMAAALGGEVEVALAARPALTAAAIRDLVGLRREAVDLALANNAGIALRGSTVDTLLERARGNAALAAALLRRADLGPTEAAALYLHAEEARRTELLASVDGLAGMRKPSLPQPDAAARSALLAHAGAKDGAAFAGELAAMLSLPATPDWRFDDPARHDLLVFALSAAGVPEEEGVRILLTLEPSISLRVDTVLRLVRLSRRLARATAAFMVEAILGAPVGVKPAGQHRPYLDPRGSASRAAAVTALRAARDDLRELRRA